MAVDDHREVKTAWILTNRKPHQEQQLQQMLRQYHCSCGGNNIYLYNEWRLMVIQKKYFLDPASLEAAPRTETATDALVIHAAPCNARDATDMANAAEAKQRLLTDMAHKTCTEINQQN